MMEAAADLNDLTEAQEKENDERKKREEGTQPAALVLKCEDTGCDFLGQNKAVLVNHVR